MFVLLSQLISNANLSGMHLMIRPSGEGQLTVIVCTESTELRADQPELRAALAQPLSVQGGVTEIDRLLTQNLTAFCESYQQAHARSNVEQVTQGHQQALQQGEGAKVETENTTISGGEDWPVESSSPEEDDTDIELF